ncbi:hypothetical protein C8Q73DRAFT_519336 [Cubamyces lactineus]|nr:hypothetical protein C8Q73DRAFT_519336 [Cubamyces lactineus]
MRPHKKNLEQSTPIPVPRFLPSVIFRKPRTRSLQSQMRLDNDYFTFSKLMWLVRHVAARHISLTVSYSRQDPEKLAQIEDEIISQSTILRDDYVDAWPITSYLKLALKTHTSSASYKGVTKHGRKKLSRDERCYKYHKQRTWAGGRRSQRISDCGSTEINYTAPAPAGAESPPPKSTSSRTPRSAQLSKYMRRYDKEGEHGYTHDEDDSMTAPARDSSEVAIDAIERDLTAAPESSYSERSSEVGPSLSSQLAGIEDGDISEVGYAAPQAAESGRHTQRYHSESSTHSTGLQTDNISVTHKGFPITAAGISRNSEGTTRVDGTNTTLSYYHGPTSAPDRSVSPYFIFPTPSPSETGIATETEAIILDPPNDILDMLLEYELPYADAERLVELLGSLGIGDTQYLRVLGNMVSCDAWLSELRVEGKLSEIQLRILREILDQLAREPTGEGGAWNQGL